MSNLAFICLSPHGLIAGAHKPAQFRRGAPSKGGCGERFSHSGARPPRIAETNPASRLHDAPHLSQSDYGVRSDMHGVNRQGFAEEVGPERRVSARASVSPFGSTLVARQHVTASTDATEVDMHNHGDAKNPGLLRVVRRVSTLETPQMAHS